MDYQPDKEIEFKRDPEEDQLDEDNLSKTTLKIPADADLSGGVLDLQHAYKALVYLMHAAHSGVTFHGNDEPVIYGWADSAFNSGEGEKKNAFGYCCQLGRKSGMFINVCRRSTLIAQSSTEAELYALAEACRELLWIKSFLGELNLSIVCETIFQDNTTTIETIPQRSTWCIKMECLSDPSILMLSLISLSV